MKNHKAELQASALIPTDFGNFRMMAFADSPENWMPDFALVAEHTNFGETVNVRIHSECITGEIFHSQKCECGQQLNSAMKYMQENGGIIIYLRQEGRNIGIINKLKAYALQENGTDTVQANLQLGFPADDRNFEIGAEILKKLGVLKINLLTNNPEKIKAMEQGGIEVLARIPLQIDANENSEGYLKTKKDYFGHLLEDKK